MSSKENRSWKQLIPNQLIYHCGKQNNYLDISKNNNNNHRRFKRLQKKCKKLGEKCMNRLHLLFNVETDKYC